MRMAFTSGTTGNPKGVTHSFETTLPAADILNGAMDVTEREVFLIYLPLGLNWGYLTLLQSIMAGGRAGVVGCVGGGAAAGVVGRGPVRPLPPAPRGLIAPRYHR